MLKILIIDDSPDKIKEIVRAIRSSDAYPKPDINTAADLYAAGKAMSETQFDLVVLDINIPLCPGDDPSPRSCDSFLVDVGRGRKMKRPSHLIGLTAYDDLYEKLNSVFATYGWLLFSIQLHRETWPKVIVERLRYINEIAGQSDNGSTGEYEYDLAVITALATPELASVLEWPVKWATYKHKNDFVEYQIGDLDINGRKVKVVAACCQHMGLVASATLTFKLSTVFKPKLIAMVGIAAGVKGRANIGDILVCEESWDYNSGKLGKADSVRVFAPDPKSIRISPEILEGFQNVKKNSECVTKAFNSWEGALPPLRPNVLVGPVASGSSVVADADKVLEILSHNRKLIGLEMETYGVYFAAQNAWSPKPAFISLKAVCDFADETKTDGFQTYAAHVSSRFLLESINCGLILAAG